MGGAPAQMLEEAERLVPVLRRRNAEAERMGRLHADTVADLRGLGCMRAYTPTKFGGMQLDWGAQVEVSEILARGCGSAAWIAGVVAPQSHLVGRYPGAAQEEVWAAGPDPLVVNASASQHARLRWTRGGYVLSGHWRFASGVDFSDWALVIAPLGDADGGIGDPYLCLLARADFEVSGDWDVVGLGATGSKNLVVEEAFVPAHRAVPLAELLGSDPPGAALHDHYLFRADITGFAGTAVVGPVLGMGRGGYEAYREATQRRVGLELGDRVAGAETVQERLGCSAADLDAARLVARQMVTLQHRAGSEGRALTRQEHATVLRDRAWVVRSCTDAVHRLWRHMGAAGLTVHNPVTPFMRDLNAAAGQISVNWDRNMVAYGRFALGLRTGIGPIDGTGTTTLT